MSGQATRFVLSAGQISDVPVLFKDPDGAAIDLTGATVHFMAKRNLADADANAIIDVSQDEHEDAEGGVSSLPIDLSGLAAEFFELGANLTGSLWLEDAAENRIPYGNFSVEIRPGAKWHPEG